ncbi:MULTISPECIES: hypothetical protein [Halostella]|uniref:hypothetical protein n=1 Tax=Halostella TaxID=1843185 RepID=UPI0018789106|nr:MULTISPECIES: hypothetical protein [Halostella]
MTDSDTGRDDDAGEVAPDPDAVRDALDRATEADREEAARLLADASQAVERLRAADDADYDRAETLAAEVDQRLRELSERDAYGGGAPEGAAMNPEDEDAP